MPERRFAEYLEESMTRMQRDVPETYKRIGDCLGHRTLRIEVGKEHVGIVVIRGQVVIGSPVESADVLSRTTRKVIVELADGVYPLEEAVVDERVLLFGAVEDMLAGLDALMAYLNGAARCPELGDLMDDFRKDGG